MRAWIACLLAVSCTVDFALAQRGDRGRLGDEPRPERFREGGPQEGRFGPPRGGRMMGGPPTPEAIMDRVSQALAERLDLDASQQTQFDEIVAVFREDMALQAEGQASPRDLFDQMRQAREDGDDAMADEIRDQMRNRFRAMGDTMDMMLEEVEPILNAEQVNRLGEFRERMAQRRRDMNPRETMEKLVDQMRTDLNMSPEQLDAFDGMVTDLEAKGEEMRNRWREMAPLMREARDAREAGDDARVEEIRAELEALRMNPGDMIDGFFDEVAAMLDPDQRELLAELREQAPFRNRGEDGRRGDRGRERLRELDLQTVLRAAKRLDLNSEQRDRVNEIESEAGFRLRQAERTEAGAVARQVKDQLEEIMTEEQKAEFNRMLGTDNERRRGDRRERGDRGDRGRRGDRGQDVEDDADDMDEDGDAERPRRRGRRP